MAAGKRWRVAPALLLSLASVLGSCTYPGAEVGAGSPTPTFQPLQILEGLRTELIPAEGSPTAYGASFSTEGYDLLRQWNTTLRPDSGWADDYEALDIRLPCCEASHPYRDETRNCGCGHHQALYGLTKRLLQGGATAGMAQDEVGRWRAFMFPRETLLAEMERRALDDPAFRQALDELRQQGVC